MLGINRSVPDQDNIFKISDLCYLWNCPKKWPGLEPSANILKYQKKSTILTSLRRYAAFWRVENRKSDTKSKSNGLDPKSDHFFHRVRQTYVRHCSRFVIEIFAIPADAKGKLLNCQHYYLKLSRFHQDHIRFDFCELERILRTFFVTLFWEMWNHSESNYSSLCSDNSIDLIISINSSRLRST